ncbi:DUF975 family protein [Marinilongibacter aquaticus]|uniref:DUF975 family protein n=1 Tax=Marinilongibacter aquaticus TaxID=2975157 RepID=UPI0021BD356D|nr:DUF975 family protein [Marinilongibacter aquaticus]UBM59013.1 DUF975 family protein [Marinilongibacter aquaticus]
MSSNIDLIRTGFDKLSGKWLIAIAFTFLVNLLIQIPNAQRYGWSIDDHTRMDFRPYSFLILFIAGALYVGQSSFFLEIIRGQEARFENIFEGFQKNYLQNSIAYFLCMVVIIIGFVLLIIPGIIMATGLSQTFYILAENKNMTAIDAMKKSWEIMDGHKMKLFLLVLLSMGLFILGILAFLIGIFVVIPIIYSAFTQFYVELRQSSPQEPSTTVI